MKFIILDTETTGTDPERNQILEIGMICVDTTIPPSQWKTLYRVVEHDEYVGQAYALALNSRIFEILKANESFKYRGKDKIVHASELMDEISKFLDFDCDFPSKKNRHGEEYISICVGGKNVASFDIPFLKNHAKKYPIGHKIITFLHRFVDPTAYFVDFFKDDKPPALEDCKKRAGLSDIVTHNAIEDSWDIVWLLKDKLGLCEHSELINEPFINELKSSGCKQAVEMPGKGVFGPVREDLMGRYMSNHNMFWGGSGDNMCHFKPVILLNDNYVLVECEHTVQALSTHPFVKYILLNLDNDECQFIWTKEQVLNARAGLLPSVTSTVATKP